MALFRKDPISRAELLELVSSHPEVRELQATAQTNVVAVLMALAVVESNRDKGAVGDAGNAFGLWQIHRKYHPWFDPTRLEDTNYQISSAVRILRSVDDAVARAAGIIRSKRDGDQPVKFSPLPDVPQWFNIAWQFGQGTLLKFFRETLDYSTAGFKAWRAQTGKPIPITWRWASKRVPAFWSEYERTDRDGPKFFRDAAAGTLGVLADLAGDASKLFEKATKKIAAEAGNTVVDKAGEKLAEILDDATDPLTLPFYILVAVVTLLAIGLVYVATVPRRAAARGSS